MDKRSEIREGMRNVLAEDLIVCNSTHEHAPPGRSCLEDCGTEDQGNGILALVRSGGKKHKKCQDCWNEYIEELITKILKKQDSQGIVIKIERELPEKIPDEINEVAERYALRPNYASELISKILLNAGYVAVESLNQGAKLLRKRSKYFP